MLSVLASVNGFMVPGLQTAAGARIALAAAVPLATVRMSEVVDDVEQVYKDADAVFACIDTDGNGAITQEELVSHLTGSGYKEEAVEKIFSKLDTNKDGALSKEELREGMVNYSPLRKAPGFGNYNAEFKEEIFADADALFDAIDQDQDGEVTDVELRIHLREFSQYSDKAITAIFSFLDLDADGGISRDEIRKAFVSYSALRQAIGAGPNYK